MVGTADAAGSPRGRRRGALLAGAVGAGLLVAVVLARGGTAASPDDLAAPAPSPSATRTGGPPPAPDDRVDVDGVADIRLGPTPRAGQATTGEWSRVGRSDDGACLLLRPGLPPAGLDVTVWVVDDVVEAVAMSASPALAAPPTTFGVGFGDDLAVAALLPGASRHSEEVPGASVGAVGWVVAEVDGVQVVASDLGGDGVRHLEVRTPAGSGCRTGRAWGGALTPAGAPGGTPAGELPGSLPVDMLPVLDAAGRAPVRFGAPVADLPALGLQEVGSFAVHPGCEMWLPAPQRPTGLTGLGAVWVRDGRVAGIGVDTGSLAEGFTVGEGVDELLRAFPELAVDAADGPLLPPLPTVLDDGRTIDVQVLDTYVVPSEVDAMLVTGSPVVRAVTVWVDPCEP